MVWNQRGKQGVHCGRTLRQNTTSRLFRYRGLARQGVILKYQKNAGDFSQKAKMSIIEDRYGLTDGLSLMSMPQATEYAPIEFSLGKRKRWQLPELVQERLVDDEDFEDLGVKEDKPEKELNLLFTERHIHKDMHRMKGDCVSVFSDEDGKTLKPRNHKYSFATDIRRLDKDSKPADIFYEICRPLPPTAWPNLKEDQYMYTDDYLYLDNVKGRKALKKCKGRRNKGEGALTKLNCDDHKEDIPKRSRKTNERKLKTLSKEELSYTVEQMSSEDDNGCWFPLGEYVDSLVNTKTPKSSAEMVFKPLCARAPVKRYGKGCAVVIDAEPCTEIAEVSYILASPTTVLDECYPSIDVQISIQDLDVSSLRSEWGDKYTEGAVSPRKFTINVTDLLPSADLKDSSLCNVLFEVHEHDEQLTGISGVITTVSLLPVSFDFENCNLKNAAQDFISHITSTSLTSFTTTDIVNAAMQVLSPSLHNETRRHSKVPKYKKTSVRSLSVLNKMCGWTSQSFSLQGALQQLKQKLNSKAAATCKKATESQWLTVSVMCGICFETCDDDYVQLTSLSECGHSFCKECWVGHLKTQISQGITCIQCPGHNCDSKVDYVTTMALVPQNYEGYLNMKLNKNLEKSPNWKWCPNRGCKKVVMATAVHLDGMTVLCDCGMAWCFKCKKESHWPATCSESELFSQKSGNYQQLVTEEKQEQITSVMIKNCPTCDYPIEKYYGCQFMYCILCTTHFCWNCCTPASYEHSCDKTESDNITIFHLPLKGRAQQFEQFLNIAVHNSKARMPKKLAIKGEMLEALEAGTTSHKAVSSTILQGTSTCSKLMGQLVENRISEVVREALEFEFQARLVLEGGAKKAAVSRGGCKAHMKIVLKQLGFVVDRIETIALEPSLICRDGRIGWLERLLSIGKDCIFAFKEYCTN